MELVTPESVGLSSERLGRVGEHLRKRYIEPGKIAGTLTLVARRGRVCYLHAEGLRDRERGLPIAEDTIFRIYSMTKPITSVGLMMLYERGLFSLTDPVERYIPSWKNLRVCTGGAYPEFETEPCRRRMTVRDLFAHTSGLTYGFMRLTEVDRAYRRLRINLARPGYTLARMAEELAGVPLDFQPGTAWNYSVSTDVLGHLIERIGGRPLDEYFERHIFGPLGMTDTAFSIAADKEERFAVCYRRDADKRLVIEDDPRDSDFRERSYFSGGGGLISTIGDYYRFCAMLRNGGELDGARILGPRTLSFMTRNHLPGGADLTRVARGGFSETAYDGIGFGLGFAVRQDSAAGTGPGSAGEYYWGGLASTLFWVDPAEDLVAIFMTQFVPSDTFDFRGQLKSIVYSAIVD